MLGSRLGLCLKYALRADQSQLYLLFGDDEALHWLGISEGLDLLNDMDPGANDHSLVNPAMT